MAEIHRICTFTLGDCLFGIPVEHIREVLHGPPLTRVPPAPRVVLGLLNLRGEIVTAVDLGLFLGIPETSPARIAVVVTSTLGTVGLFVDAVGEVLELSEDRFEPPPDTLWDPPRSLLAGIYALEDRLLLALDVDRTLHALASNS